MKKKESCTPLSWEEAAGMWEVERWLDAQKLQLLTS